MGKNEKYTGEMKPERYDEIVNFALHYLEGNTYDDTTLFFLWDRLGFGCRDDHFDDVEEADPVYGGKELTGRDKTIENLITEVRKHHDKQMRDDKTNNLEK